MSDDPITFFNYKPDEDGEVRCDVERRPMTEEERQQPYVQKTLQLAEDNPGRVAAGFKLERDGEVELEDADLLDRLGERPLGNINEEGRGE
jgi:hypothetical protein